MDNTQSKNVAFVGGHGIEAKPTIKQDRLTKGAAAIIIRLILVACAAANFFISVLLLVSYAIQANKQDWNNNTMAIIQSLMMLIMVAICTAAYFSYPNVPSHLSRTGGAADAGSEATKHPA